ncbi:MAG: outer membrane protein assembly factor BamB [Gammaproteobacteria bacterium]|jgi:outer membrane protein assembly factor BamB|nr:outer membrane protein assembly factor BamB [Gammaproteobacteria bacterium]
MIKRFGLLLCLACLSACGVTESVTEYLKGDSDNAEPPAELIEFRQRLNVVELWSENIGSGTDKQYLKLAPVVANQRLYVADADGRIQARDATNGNQIWSIDTDTRITGGPGFGENTILIGTGEGETITYSADDGEEMWRTTVSSEILSPPQKALNTVIVRTGDGKVFGLSGNSGKRLWIYDRTVPSLTLRGTSNPIISGDLVIAGFDGGKMAALDVRTGKLAWEASVAVARGSTDVERMVDIDSTPLIVDGVIYIATFQGHLSAMQLETGRVLWDRDISSYAGFGVDQQNIYVTDDKGHIWAFDRFTSTEAWKQEKLHMRSITAPASIGDFIVVGDYEGYLHWMSKASGKFVARTELCGKRIITPPLVVGKILYGYCSDGSLTAYSYR